MAYDEALVRRVREVIATRAQPAEIKMFRGLCFLVNTHMVAGVTQHGLLIKVGKEQVEDAVARGGIQPMMGERVMTGMVRIGEPVLERDGLDAWVLPVVEAALARTPKPQKKLKSQPGPP